MFCSLSKLIIKNEYMNHKLNNKLRCCSIKLQSKYKQWKSAKLNKNQN